MAFLETRDGTWACFLVTARAERGSWQGYFSFRSGRGETEEDEVRTAPIFIEASETEIYDKARGLGRPLLLRLLESALFTRERRGEGEPRLRGRFRSLLARIAGDRSAGDQTADEWGARPDEGGEGGSALARLRSLYASYRLDQVAHLIGLVEPEAFEAAVDRILEGASVDFASRDRMQYAMMVVDHLEGLLPLPDFATWAEDYLRNPDAYRLYAHVLHREGRLP